MAGTKKGKKKTTDEARRVTMDAPAPKTVGALAQDLIKPDKAVVKAAFEALAEKNIAENEQERAKFVHAGGCFLVVQAMKNSPT